MRGDDNLQEGMFSYVSPEKRVPADHPLRPIRKMVDEILKEECRRSLQSCTPKWGAHGLRPSGLFRSLLLQILYSVRSERMLIEQLRYNLLFRWFVGMEMDEAVWNHAVFSKNRERLLNEEIAESFFQRVLERAKPKKSKGSEAKLGYLGHVLMENRNGLLVQTFLTEANGRAERDAAMLMAEAIPGGKRVTLGGDKNYDTQEFVGGLRGMNITPHVAQNNTNRRSAVDERTTRHAGYEVSQRKRKRVEQSFGWMKMVGMLKKVKLRGIDKVGWLFTFTGAAYNLCRLRNLMART